MRKLILALCILAVSTVASAQVITLTWDANTESDLAGYRMYQNDEKVGEIPAGTETYTTPDLPEGDYSWYITAFDTKGLESGKSNTVSEYINDPPVIPTGLRSWAVKIMSWLKSRFGGLRIRT